MKNINSKMTTNSQLSTTEPKNTQKPKHELSKQLAKDQNHRNRDHMEGYQWGRGEGRMREKVQGLGSINGRYKNRHGEFKNSVGNGEDKELLCMTHGH